MWFEIVALIKPSQQSKCRVKSSAPQKLRKGLVKYNFQPDRLGGQAFYFSGE
jgi:hypothetical protein